MQLAVVGTDAAFFEHGFDGKRREEELKECYHGPTIGATAGGEAGQCKTSCQRQKNPPKFSYKRYSTFLQDHHNHCFPNDIWNK